MRLWWVKLRKQLDRAGELDPGYQRPTATSVYPGLRIWSDEWLIFEVIRQNRTALRCTDSNLLMRDPTHWLILWWAFKKESEINCIKSSLSYQWNLSPSIYTVLPLITSTALYLYHPLPQIAAKIGGAAGAASAAVPGPPGDASVVGIKRPLDDTSSEMEPDRKAVAMHNNVNDRKFFIFVFLTNLMGKLERLI